MMSTTSALNILGLRPGASPEEVRSAYLALIRATHPDLASDKDDSRERERRARLVNKAHERLREFGTGVGGAPPSAPASSGTHKPPGDRLPEGGLEETPVSSSPPASARRTSMQRKRPHPWVLTVGGATVLAGMALRLMHVWDVVLASTPWGDESLALNPAMVLLLGVVGFLLVGRISFVTSRPAHLALLIGAVLGTSFFELHHRLNWAEISILVVLLVVWPFWQLLTRP